MKAQVLASSLAGILVAVLLGLSTSEVVAATLSALLAALLAFLGLTREPVKVEPKCLAGFCALCILVLPLAIMTRTHGWLSPSLENRVAEMVKAGFDQSQAVSMVSVEEEKLGKSHILSVLKSSGKRLEGLDPAGYSSFDSVLVEWTSSDHSELSESALEIKELAVDDETKFRISKIVYNVLEKTWGH